ncbi:MAG: adenylate/guanylate cyclase domain-containing protein [Bacteroidales bacterium]
MSIQNSALFYEGWPLVLISVNIILLVSLIMMWKSLRFAKERFMLEGIINERTEELLNQKEKVDELLSNMLPKETVDQLKLTGRASTQKYNMVSILFSDIEGFTRIAEQMNPEVLVDELDKFFFKFDSVVGEFNIEKIKTIGDAYMAAGGIPDRNHTNPIDIVMAAISIMQYMKHLKKENEYFFDLRIGIHTGPVIAGVVGQKKLSYDIWGDSVNTASRMESSGESGKINISGSTYEYIKDYFTCEYRGKMPVKYKGNIDMYFVKGFRPEFSVDMQGQKPNERFFIKLQLVRLQDIEEEFIKRMEEELPVTLQFHDQKYCIELLTQCELLFSAEKLSDEEQLLVRTAALFDCMSYSKGYKERSKYIDQLTRENLPGNHYNEKQIIKICKLINLPFFYPEARSLPEKVLSDARLAFIGKNNFNDSVNRLYEEMKSYGITESKKEFTEMFAGFLKSFHFYTLTAQKLVEVPVENQINVLTQWKTQPDQLPTDI